MTKNQSLDDLVKQEAIQFADQINKAAEFAKTEMEIQMEAFNALKLFSQKMGIHLRGRHNHTIGTGRPDSVYGCVIIEYKNPHDSSARLSSNIDSPGNQKVIKQIQKRFSDFKQEYNVPLDTMFGVGCDGKYFIFVRCRDERWYVEDPVEVNRYSSEQFLWALINMGTKGKAFAPEYLAGDFGSDSPLSHEGIKAFYSTICSTSSPKAKVFFEQWKILFGEVCGYDVDTPSDKIEKLADFYGIEGDLNPPELLFSIHTYYSIFMKLLASEIVAFFHKLPTPLHKILKAPTSNKLKEEMEDLESGSIFHHLNITNFLEGDLFAWYPDAWNDSIDKLVRDMAIKLDGYNPGTLSEDPAGSRDLLKKLYQQLFPKSVRHDLGEYYTPDWLAEHVLNELEYEGNPDKRMLDPACGSGTFLVMAINRIRKWYDEHRDSCGFDEGGLARKILENVVGFDLNPLAVMAARTNYLIAMRDLVGRVNRVEIPIYLCDSIMTPYEYGGLDTWTTGKQIKTKELKTSVSNFKIPLEIAENRYSIAKYTEQLEFCIRHGYNYQDFIERCKNEGLTIIAEDLHRGLYEELVRLDKENKNSVWSRIIKNAFAPLFCDKFDYIAGNPPWIGWEDLPEDYRNNHKDLWYKYDLLIRKKGKGYLSESSIDFSVLFTYSSIDTFLVNKGKLGFVITQTLFKSELRGAGYRTLKISKDIDLKPIIAEDMVELQPFENANNKTGVIVIQKGKKCVYPFNYRIWKKKNGSIPTELPLDEVMRLTTRLDYVATPVSSERGSPWVTTPKSLSGSLEKIYGPSKYIAKVGVDTLGASGVFWIRIIKVLNKDTILIENLFSSGKKSISLFQASVESKHVYPLVRGGDISRWIAKPSSYIILPHTKETQWRAISIPEMKRKYPLTFSYLHHFQNVLSLRPSYIQRRASEPFYILMRAYQETFLPFKVVWQRMSNKLKAAVVNNEELPTGDSKPIITSDTTTFVGFSTDGEAHYLCALLNSSICRYAVFSYSSAGRGFGSPHLLEHISIPKFNSKNDEHILLATLSRKCHNAALKGDNKEIIELEAEIDKLAARLWNTKEKELHLIRGFLNENEASKIRGRRQNSTERKKTYKKTNKIITEAAKDLLQDIITPEALMHLSHKAKYNDMLAPKQRGALFKLARLKSRGNKLTEKQITYLESILKEAIDQGIIDAKCNHHECEICNKLQDTFNK